MLRSMIFNYNSTHPHPIAWGGVGWGGVGWDNNVIGISTWTWCYALWPSIAIPHEPDATLYDLQLQFHTSASDSLGWGGVGWDNNVIGNSTWTWCYAQWSSIAIPHDLDATLYDLHWHFHMNLMLRSMIFNCNSTHPHPIAWGGVRWGGIVTSLAFPHEPDATLYDLQLQFHMNLMLRSMIFNWNSTHPHPIAWGGVGWGGIITSLAFPHEPDATLYDLQLQFHMTWCYALWSSITNPHIRIR